jgi:hypothetical protein
MAAAAYATVVARTPARDLPRRSCLLDLAWVGEAQKKADLPSRSAAPRSPAGACCPAASGRARLASAAGTSAGARDADSDRSDVARGEAVAHVDAWSALLPRDGCRSFPDLLFRSWDEPRRPLPSFLRGPRATPRRLRPDRPSMARWGLNHHRGCQISWSAVPPSSSSSSVSRVLRFYVPARSRDAIEPCGAR